MLIHRGKPLKCGEGCQGADASARTPPPSWIALSTRAARHFTDTRSAYAEEASVGAAVD